MKYQLWMRAREGRNKVKVYQTVDEPTAYRILEVLLTAPKLDEHKKDER